MLRRVSSRGNEWMYYLCRDCGLKAIVTKDADSVVLARVGLAILPAEIIEASRTSFDDSFRSRLAAHQTSCAPALNCGSVA